jgi:hypothetical protein
VELSSIKIKFLHVGFKTIRPLLRSGTFYGYNGSKFRVASAKTLQETAKTTLDLGINKMIRANEKQ